jgi:hypothetical protein
MKILLARTKRGTSIRFRAASHAEAVDLKDLIVALGDRRSVETLAGAIEKLGERGYRSTKVKETKNTVDWEMSKPHSPVPAGPTPLG